LDAESQRLFFALWPDEIVRDRLHGLSARFLRPGSGRPVTPDNFHVTVFFLGDTDTAKRACAEQVAGTVSRQAFTLTLDQVGYWQRPQVLWVGATRTPEELLALVGDLNVGLSACGFSPERRDYRAHVTVARKVRRGPHQLAAVDAVSWRVERFCLVESVTESAGVRYRVLRCWALG
jgi:RNA 2',3'-cyclic 3'-phosphodiesterase